MRRHPEIRPLLGNAAPRRFLAVLLLVIFAVSLASCGGGTGDDATGAPRSWKRSFGGSGSESSVYGVNAPDGGFLIVGTTASSDGDMTGYNGGASDVWIAKLDDAGTVVWSKCFGGTGADRVSGLVATADGYVLAGDTTSPDGDLCPSAPDSAQRAWAALFDLEGNFVSLSNVSASSASDARGGIRPTADGGFVLAGAIFDGAYWYAWAVKFDASLQQQWERRLAANSGMAYAYDVAQKADGNYLVCGYTEFGAGAFAGTGYHAGNDGFVFELDQTTGAVVQGKCFGGSSNDSCTGVVPTADGGFYVVGTTNSADGTCPATLGASDVMLLKVNSDFTVDWAKNAGGSSSELGGRGQLSAAGGLLFYATTASTDGDVVGNHAATDDLWFGECDTAGNLLWQQCFGGTADDSPPTFLAAPDGGYLVGGYGGSNDGDLAGTGHRSGNDDFILSRRRAFPSP